MAKSVYSRLNSMFGSPRRGDDLLRLGLWKRAELVEQHLLPTALDADALADSVAVANACVTIAGAGLAGLSAAWYLQRCGVGIDVFECSSRPGGRVRTDRDVIAGWAVEAGAELIGANHPMWVTMATTFGLPLVEVSDESDYEAVGLRTQLRIGDLDLSDTDKKLLYDELQILLDIIGQEAAGIDRVRPWLSPDAAAYDGVSVAERIDQLAPPVSELTLAVFESSLANDLCVPTMSQSYLALLALVSGGRVGDDAAGLRGYWEYGATHRCRDGNDRLVEALAGEVAPNIWFDDGVRSVDVSPDGVQFETDSGVGRCDYFVLSAPPTAWPAVTSTSDFDHQLHTMSHGPAVKYLASAATPVWAETQRGPLALWDELGSVWESTDNQPIATEFGLSVSSGGPSVRGPSDYPAVLATLYPGFTAAAERYVDWTSVDGIGTGQSVPSPGQVTTTGAALYEPHGRLYFAGEQSCVPYFGSMEGALQSGVRAARDIVAQLCPEAFA